MAIYHIGLGSNLGARYLNLRQALRLIDAVPETRVHRVSQFLDTSPVGGPPGQGRYLNAAAELESGLAPAALMARLLAVERQMGRQRVHRWEPRLIDLDILLAGPQRIQGAGLTIPHPEMHYRGFVLRPLAEIAPDAQHPDGWTVSQRWRQLQRRPRYLALTGPMGVGKTTVARRLAERLGARFVAERFDAERLGRLYAGEAGQMPDIQAAFLEHRCQLLGRDRFSPRPPEWVVSDFWFAQSLAYARVWQDAAAVSEHGRQIRRLARQVLEPTLVVWLDAEPDELARRVSGRGRQFERPVQAALLTELRDAYAGILTDPASRPTAAPLYVYRLANCDLDLAVERLAEVAEAIVSGDGS